MVSNKIGAAGSKIEELDPCTALEIALWKESAEALCFGFGVWPEVVDSEVLPFPAQHTSVCQLVSRMYSSCASLRALP